MYPVPVPVTKPATLVQAIRSQIWSNPEKRAVGLAGASGEPAWISMADLDHRAVQVAASLRAVAEPGALVVLLHAPGIDFVAGLLGILYAGMVAVPAYPPDPARLARTLPRFLAMLKDSGAQVVLGDAELAQARDLLAQSSAATVHLTVLTAPGPDQAADPAALGDPAPDDLAIVQYTSGSTRTPRGVLLRHGNLSSNVEFLHAHARLQHEEVACLWLPPHHDMGLLNILYTLVKGSTLVMLSPIDFIRRPRRWLELMTEHRAAYAGSPNFGFDLCVRKVPPETCAGLDLSAWRVAFNGAEPIRASTLASFEERFSPVGFNRRAWLPCYGLAETAVGAHSARAEDEVVVRTLSRTALERDLLQPDPQGVAMVGCGLPQAEEWVALRIVDPETRTVLPDGHVGEIWLAGPSVSHGYHHNPEATQAAFGQRLEGQGAAWLRTGDRGGRLDGELFVTGRSAGLIIVRGRNIMANDIEASAEAAHRALRPGCSAAFQTGDRLSIVLEADVRGGLNPRDLTDNVRRRVLDELRLQLDDVILIAPRTVPKTSSGKVQRGKTAAMHAKGALEVLYHDATPQTPTALGPVDPGAGASWPEAELLAWVAARVAARLGVSPTAIDPDERLRSLGLDSVSLVEVADETATVLGLGPNQDDWSHDPTLRAWVARIRQP